MAIAVWLGNALLVRHAGDAFGPAPFDMPVAVDVLIVVPLLYAWVHRRNGARAWLGGALIAMELGVVLWLARALWQLHGVANLEMALQAQLEPHRAAWGAASGLLALEARMWMYALVPRPVAAPFPGSAHFFGAGQQSNAANQQAFLILIAMEMPLMHGLLHVTAGATTAWIVTVLSLYGWVWMLAEWRATRLRPVSIDGDALHLRYGVVTDARIALGAILQVDRVPAESVRRARGRLRCYGMGAPNLRLQLAPGTRIDGVFGSTEVEEIHLGLDSPEAFLQALQASGQARG